MFERMLVHVAYRGDGASLSGRAHVSLVGTLVGFADKISTVAGGVSCVFCTLLFILTLRFIIMLKYVPSMYTSEAGVYSIQQGGIQKRHA